MKRKRRSLLVEFLEDRRLLAGDITQVGYFDTWAGGIIRSTDIAGIAYHPPSGHLYLADSEINELPAIFNGDNLFETSLSGDHVFREIASNNTEPTGITYNEFDGYFYVTNDTGSKTVTRYDMNLNNPLLVISTKDDVSSAKDPEGITSDPATGFLYVSDGNGGGRQVLTYNSNLEFQSVFSVSSQMSDAEGIAYHQPSNHLFLVDGSQDMIFEYTLNGNFVEEYDIKGFSPAPKSPQGLTFAPTSNPFDDPNALSLYIADGMKDNFADGRVFEAVIGDPTPPGNLPPTTSGIADVNVNVDAPNTVIDLFAAFADFEDPDTALTFTVEDITNPYLFTATTINGALGTLTLDYAPATAGTADITVRATDTGTPPLFVETTFTVSVSPVNQPPTTTGIADVTVGEDAGNSMINLFAAFDDPEDPDSALTYTIQANTNPALFAATPIDGALGTLALDYAPDATGMADITVRATDTGFPVRSVDTTFQVTVTEVNDIPALTAGTISNLTVVQNSPVTSLGLAGLVYGPGGGVDENGQTLSYAVTTVPSSTLGDVVLADGATVVTPGAYTLAQIQGMQFHAAANVFGGPETFSFTVIDNGTTNGADDFKTLDQSLQINVIEFIPDPITVDVQVAASSDDAEERPSGSVTLTSSDLELTQDGTNQQIVGMRFTGVSLPPAASIQAAYIQFQVDETGSDNASLTIRGEAADNALTFTATSGNITSRTATAASVPWMPAPWLTTGEAGPNQRTEDISTVIQEIVNRPGWSSGNSLAIIISGTGDRTAEAFNGVPTAAPRLHVEYLPGNFAPTTSGIADVHVNTDAPDTIIDLFAAFDDIEDPDSALTYSIENNTNPSLFTATTIDGVLGTLTLAYAPATTGTADITIRAADTGTPPSFVETTFTVWVSPVNQTPTTTGIADVVAAEDAGNTAIDLFAAFDDSEDPDSALIYTVETNTNSALFTSTNINGALGTLTLDYAPDASGSADITVRATDTGFPERSVDTTFTVTLTEVNDTPIRSSGSVDNLTVVQNSPATPLGLAGLVYGPGGGEDENGQTLSYAVTTVPSSPFGDVVLADGATVVTPGAYTLAQIQGMQFQAAADVFGGPETFSFTVTDNGMTNGADDFKTLSQSLQIDVIEFIPDPITVDVQVAASSDDAEERPTGNVTLTSSDLELTQDGTNQQVVGMRFTGLNIPPGASIQNAYLQFQVDETGSDVTSLTIHGEAADNAATFIATSGNITSRTTTAASVPWMPAPWLTTGEAGPDQRTDDISTVIQEIVNRPGWSSGNSLAIIISGTGDRTAESFNGVPAAAPRLHVEYLTGDAFPLAANDIVTTSLDTPATTNVLANDALGNPPTAITAVTQGSNGAVTFDAVAGTTTYSPDIYFVGTDSYTYTITDADGDASVATVDVTVTDGTAPSPLDFRLMGDVPYSQSEYSELEADLATVGATDEFFAHVGDITAETSSCDESLYSSMESSLLTSSIPVFIVPGDNEWNDCSNPDQAWSYWDTHLMRLEENWSHIFTVLRQSVREENFAFVHSGALFIGLNLVGGSVHDSSEWAQRMTDNADWVNENLANFGSQVTSAVVFGHAFPDPTGGDRQEFGEAFVAAAQNFGKPILYAMGDDHHFLLDNPFSNAPNITRLVVDQGVPSIRVTVTHDATTPFLFDQTPSALRVQSAIEPLPGAKPLDEGQLAAIVDEAILRLSESGGLEAANLLSGLNFEIVDLSGNLLGQALNGTIQIDVDAAGYGWFVDATPHDNVEFMYDAATSQFVAAVGSPASGRVDLLTVVLHELEHVLGLEHTDSHSLMQAELPLGTRRLATELSGLKVDALYELLGSVP